MTSLSRLELVKKFRKELNDWNSMAEYRSEKAMDTTHIQMASLDEMMSAYGYVPRRLPNFFEISDGRFGYQRAMPFWTFSMPQFISLEDAVSMHNGNGYKGNPFRRMNDRMAFALSNRIVVQVGIQRDKCLDGGIKSTKKWVKFQDNDNVLAGWVEE